MATIYRPESIEKQAQTFWDTEHTFKTDTKDSASRSKNYYCLSMFPYTSGNIHMGHVRNYTIGDVKSRMKKMQGYNVLQPMGWDSFGLPAENAAIKNKSHPAIWTRQNISSMKEQLKRIGFAYDWSREMATCDSDYYQWQQWLFIEMYKKGLVYKKDAIVNWDPVDQTVLANEQVINGRGWRSNALVEQKKIAQWFCKITDYADRLQGELDTLDKWPEAVKIMQKNWIGKSTGASIDFQLKDSNDKLTVFTTRADTLFGATFMAIAADHPLAIELGKQDNAMQTFLDQCKKQSTAEADIQTAEKMGIKTPLVAINPINGEELPVWIANYILMNYGTGAIMAVPAEDERDHEFAEKYQIAVKTVFDDNGCLINADEFTGLKQEEATASIIKKLDAKGCGKKSITYRLRDWGISRQRYWGVPIPMVHCDTCGTVPEDQANLPVKLPENIDYQYGESLLENCEDFIHVKCPICGKPARRETDTFDTFFDSSWYYHYFISQGKDGITSKSNDYWMGVDLYIGGIEHAILHLLYARFIQKVLMDLSLTEVPEPFSQLLSQGMVLKDGAKMSKSKGNVISPDALIEQYGADTIRLFIIFAAPPTQDLDWSDGGVEGCYRFLKRVWALVNDHIDDLKETSKPFEFTQTPKESQRLMIDIHKELVNINRDAGNIQLNTVASGAMKLFQLINKVDWKKEHMVVLKEAVSILLRVLNPITPHIAHFLWQEGHFGDNIATADWPQADSEILKAEDSVTIIMQINGKKRGSIQASSNATQEDVVSAIEQDESTKAQLDKHQCIKKTIYVKNKLINFVV